MEFVISLISFKEGSLNTQTESVNSNLSLKQINYSTWKKKKFCKMKSPVEESFNSNMKFKKINDELID